MASPVEYRRANRRDAIFADLMMETVDAGSEVADKPSTPIRNYGDVLRCRNSLAKLRRFLSLARSICRSRRVKVHLNGLAAR